MNRINWWRVLGLGLIILPWLLFAAIAHGQTLNGVVTECGQKCSGGFSVVNNDLKPLAVTLEAHAFSVIDGKQQYHALDPASTITLSETSARIGPKGSRDFDFKLRCAELPCAVQILVKMTLGHTDTGLQVSGVIPHTIYSCQKEKNCRATTLRSWGLVQ